MANSLLNNLDKSNIKYDIISLPDNNDLQIINLYSICCLPIGSLILRFIYQERNASWK